MAASEIALPREDRREDAVSVVVNDVGRLHPAPVVQTGVIGVRPDVSPDPALPVVAAKSGQVRF